MLNSYPDTSQRRGIPAILLIYNYPSAAYKLQSTGNRPIRGPHLVSLSHRHPSTTLTVLATGSPANRKAVSASTPSLGNACSLTLFARPSPFLFNSMCIFMRSYSTSHLHWLFRTSRFGMFICGLLFSFKLPKGPTDRSKQIRSWKEILLSVTCHMGLCAQLYRVSCDFRPRPGRWKSTAHQSGLSHGVPVQLICSSTSALEYSRASYQDSQSVLGNNSISIVCTSKVGG